MFPKNTVHCYKIFKVFYFKNLITSVAHSPTRAFRSTMLPVVVFVAGSSGVGGALGGRAVCTRTTDSPQEFASDIASIF
jgi:hypothetical protein